MIFKNHIESITLIILFIINVQNIWNLIGREEYNICRIILSVSVLYSLTKWKNKQTKGKFNFHGEKNRNVLNKNKIMVNH